MKTLSIIALLFLLTNCAGGKTSKIFFGEKCTQADAKQVQENEITRLKNELDQIINLKHVRTLDEIEESSFFEPVEGSMK